MAPHPPFLVTKTLVRVAHNTRTHLSRYTTTSDNIRSEEFVAIETPPTAKKEDSYFFQSCNKKKQKRSCSKNLFANFFSAVKN